MILFNFSNIIMLNIVFLHLPSMWKKPIVSKELKPIIKKLNKYGKVHNYFFKFSYFGNRFNLSDLLFENGRLLTISRDLGTHLLLEIA